MPRRTSLTWFVVAVVAIQIAVVGVSIALASNLPAVANALSGAATVILAGLTVLVLVYNAGVLDATRESAKATREEAEATREEARATREQTEATKRHADIALESLEELRRSRELDAQPLIVRQETGARTVGGRAVRDIDVTNIGRGPALNCVYVRESAAIRREIVRTGAFSLAAGHHIPLPAEQIDSDLDSATSLFASDDLPREVLVCQDQFGNAFRFTPGFPKPDVIYRRDLDQPHRAVPQWATVYSSLVAQRSPEPEPQPGPYFMQATHIGNYSQCQTTVVWEAVPATDLPLSDAEST